MKFFRNRDEINSNDYYIATYEMSSSANLREAAWNLAIGQSVGNPSVRNEWETDALFENHSCLVVGDEDFLKHQTEGIVEIAFPVVNTDWETDGISHLLCQLMGGHVDIDIVTKCRLIKLELPETVTKHFLGPKFGLSGFRELTGQYNKPLFGSIVKPKIGITPEVLLEMVKQMVDGGVDFIKEDEILSNPNICRLEDRVELISNYLQDKRVVYCFCINSDPAHIENRARFVSQNGGNGVHINVWSGLGSYRTIRNLDLPLFIHYQKSGDKVITGKRNPFGIEWTVLCQLAAMSGVDTIHAGMWGGYLSDPEDEITAYMKVLHDGNVVPALSCGMTAELIPPIVEKFGVDWMANVGGAIHGHPDGTLAGARKIRDAIDAYPY